jgi:cytochrome c oxidase cbb3-type subunit III
VSRGVLFGLLLVCAAVPSFAQPGGGDTPNPFLNNPQAVQQGGEIYARSCTACHGAEGAAGEIGPAIVSPERLERQISDAPILNMIRKGGPGKIMPAFAGKLTDNDILKVVSYLHALRGTAIDNPLPGDVAHGAQVFWGKGQCGSCHMIGGKGGLTGPDLSNIAGLRKAVTIVDTLTKPQHQVYGDGGAHLESLPPMNTYLPVHVTTADGKTIDGVVINQDSYSLQVMGSDEQLHLFDRTKLLKVVIESKSHMPTDYDKRLTPNEFKDLLAFLTRQALADKRSSRPPPSAGGGQ